MDFVVTLIIVYALYGTALVLISKKLYNRDKCKCNEYSCSC